MQLSFCLQLCGGLKGLTTAAPRLALSHILPDREKGNWLTQRLQTVPTCYAQPLSAVDSHTESEVITVKRDSALHLKYNKQLCEVLWKNKWWFHLDFWPGRSWEALFSLWNMSYNVICGSEGTLLKWWCISSWVWDLKPFSSFYLLFVLIIFIGTYFDLHLFYIYHLHYCIFCLVLNLS